MLGTLAVPTRATTLQHLREARHLSRQQLGELAQVHPLTILRIEHAERPRGIRFDTLRKLAAVFGVPPHELLAEPEPELEPAPDPAPSALVPMPARPDDPDDVLFIRDLAAKLKCSALTIRRTLRDRPQDLPRPLPSVDKRYRWSRRMVERWFDGDPTAGGSPAPARRKPLTRLG